VLSDGSTVDVKLEGYRTEHEYAQDLTCTGEVARLFLDTTLALLA
jgi:hypothetical protein